MGDWFQMVKRHDNKPDPRSFPHVDNELREILEALRVQKAILVDIYHWLSRPVKLIITQTGEPSVTQGQLKGIAPGGTGTFAISPVDQNGNPAQLPSGVVPQWTSSDPTNAPVTQSADGLTASVTVAQGDQSPSFTLTVTATLPDGTQPSGSAAVPILVLEVAAFVITQTS